MLGVSYEIEENRNSENNKENNHHEKSAYRLSTSKKREFVSTVCLILSLTHEDILRRISADFTSFRRLGGKYVVEMSLQCNVDALLFDATGYVLIRQLSSIVFGRVRLVCHRWTRQSKRQTNTSSLFAC
jgi:hypothetical protein